MPDELLALTLWPEWVPCFQRLDKAVDNRPRPPWPKLSPSLLGPGPWIAMHAGKEIGGPKPPGVSRRGHIEGALRAVALTAEKSGWTWTLTEHGSHLLSRPGDRRFLHLNEGSVDKSCVPGVFRIVNVVTPGVGGPWRFREQFGYKVECRWFAEPVRNVTGAQGFWRAPPEVVAAARLVGVDCG